jgi:hypothetical protein
MQLKSALTIALAVASGAASLSCPTTTNNGQPTVTVDSASNSAVLANDYVCVQINGGKISYAAADYDGKASYGKNLFAAGGLTLQREDPSGTVHSSADVSGAVLQVVQQSATKATISVTGIRDHPSLPVVEESWLISLSASDRAFEIEASGRLLRDVHTRTIRRQWEMSPASIYAWFEGGVVQMKGAGGGTDFYASADKLLRVYGLGDSNYDVAGNAAFDIIPSYSSPIQTVLMSSENGAPYWSGLQELLAGDFGNQTDYLDHWKGGWDGQIGVDVHAGTSWKHQIRVGINNFDFPVATLKAGQANLLRDDLHAILTGVYASPVGCLCTHVNEVQDGVQVAQIATTPARPDRGYQDTYNYFDPDNYFSTTAMLWSNEPFLQEQVRLVLERSGSFLKPDGQLPHHFEVTTPIYQALSGEIQTGPNVFWILSCFNYAKATQDLDWLKNYMPKIRQASNFLFSLIDPQIGLANVPGSLMIDVFLRSNFTSDTNAQLVGFFQEFADAEEAVGNSTGAATLRSLSSSISDSMNKYLWSPTEPNHYVTQWNGPEDNTYRDFVDYDANLIATAHGIPDADRAAKVLAKIDGGKCRTTATYVSQIYYGPNDTTNGNTGDSDCAMGRIAWFDALSRKRYNALESFENYIMNPLQKILLASTWMHERLACDGTQQEWRTAMYFEYPSTVSMLMRKVRYGIDLGFGKISIAPFGVKEFSYHIGNLDIEFAADRVKVEAPFYKQSVEFSLSSMTPSVDFIVHQACSENGVKIISADISASSDANGVLNFKVDNMNGCSILVSRK